MCSKAVKGRSGGGCRQRAERREAWQEVGRVKKYKSGTGNGQNFSWKEPTKGNGALNIKSYPVFSLHRPEETSMRPILQSAHPEHLFDKIIKTFLKIGSI